MTEQATMTLPLDLVRPAIDAQVKKAMLDAFDKTDLIGAFVSDMLNYKVDAEGKHGPNAYRCDTPWIDFQIRKTLQDAVAECIKEAMKTRTDEIKKMVEAEFRKPKSKLLAAVVNGMATGMSELGTQYKVHVEFSYK